MPIVKPQNMKSISTIESQPSKMNSKMKIMIMMDIGGASGIDISRAVGLTEPRVSVIRNSPMFIDQKEVAWQELSSRIIDKTSDKVVAGDPVELKIKDLAIKAVEEYEHLLESSESDVVRKSTADAVLDRAGYKAFTEKTKVSVEVTEKMADRFEEALKYEHSPNARKTKIKITQEMSS